MRLPKEWQKGLYNNQILVLSYLNPAQNRHTAKQSEKRNRLVAALADEVYFAYMSQGGKSEKLASIISEWRV